MNPGPWGIIIIAVVVLLLFGRGKIAGMMGEVANGIKAFQRGMKDEEKPVAQIDGQVDRPADAEKERENSRNA